jgi:hypothetical protein
MTDHEQNDEVRRDLTPVSEADLKLTHDRVLQRIGDAIRMQGQEERALWGPLGRFANKPLADFEQRVLIATLALEGAGEVSSITAKVNESLVQSSGSTAVFFTLNRLEGEGLISSRYTDRANRYFKVTEEGEHVLILTRPRAETTGLLGDLA